MFGMTVDDGLPLGTGQLAKMTAAPGADLQILIAEDTFERESDPFGLLPEQAASRFRSKPIDRVHVAEPLSDQSNQQ